MASALNCSGCGERATEIAPGPFGFIQSCHHCGSDTHFDDMLEPVRESARANRQLQVAA